MAASKAIFGIAVPVVGAGLYAMTNRGQQPAVPVRNEQVRTAGQQATTVAGPLREIQKLHREYCEHFLEPANIRGPPLALTRTASRRVKEVTADVRRLHKNYCETFVEAPPPASSEAPQSPRVKKFEIKRSASRINMI